MKFYKFIAPVCILFFCQCVSALNIESLAKKKWLEVRSENFILVTDQNEKRARYIVQDLEEFRYFTLKIRKLEVVENLPPLLVFTIGSRNSFKNLGLRKNVAGFFPGQGTVYML